ncbi:jg24402, partial [Pararge aegeria aegeria]
EPHIHIPEQQFQQHSRTASGTLYEGERYAVWKRQEAPPYYEAPPPAACCRPQHDHHPHTHQPPLKVSTVLLVLEELFYFLFEVSISLHFQNIFKGEYSFTTYDRRKSFLFPFRTFCLPLVTELQR